ncbi:MAG: TRAP transporter substrate-binding protein [bacterium]
MLFFRAKNPTILFISALLFFHGGASGAAAAQKYVFKLGSVAPAASAWGKVAQDFVVKLEKLTNHELKVEMYLGGQLGSEQSMLQMVQMGTLQGAAVTSSAVTRLVPEMQIFDLPFLFKDVEEARFLTDLVIEPRINRELAKKNLFGTSIFENGFRNFIAKKFITAPEDLGKMKFASEESQLYLAFWQSLGASAVPKPVTEVFTSLQRGVVDGTDNSILGILALNLHATPRGRYITISEHVYQAAIVVINNEWFQAFPDHHRESLLKQNHNMAEGMRKETFKEINNTISALKRSKVKFYTLTEEEKKPFIEKTQPVYDKFAKLVDGNFLDDVLKARKVYRALKKEGKDDDEIRGRIRAGNH